MRDAGVDVEVGPINHVASAGRPVPSPPRRFPTRFPTDMQQPLTRCSPSPAAPVTETIHERRFKHTICCARWADIKQEGQSAIITVDWLTAADGNGFGRAARR